MCLELLDQYSMLWRLDLMLPMGAGRVRSRSRTGETPAFPGPYTAAKDSMTSP